MLLRLWRLLSPGQQKAFKVFVLLAMLYEGINIAFSYQLTMLLQFWQGGTFMPNILAIAAASIVLDELYMRLDNYFDYYIASVLVYPIYRHLKLTSIHKFAEMDLPWHAEQDSGALIGKVNNGVAKTEDIVDQLVWEFIPTLVQMVFSTVPLLILSWPTAVILLLSSTLFFWQSYEANREKRPMRKERHDGYETDWSKSTQMVQGIKTVQLFGQEHRLYHEQEELHNRLAALGTKEAHVAIYKYNRRRIRMLSMARRLSMATWFWQLSGGIFVIGALSFSAGQLDVPNLIFVSTLTEKLIISFWRFSRLFDRTTEAGEAVERLSSLFSAKTKRQNNRPAIHVSGPVGIVMEHVYASYISPKETRTVLRDLSLTIAPGEKVALVGTSGAGKSTVARVITGQQPIDSGVLRIAGHEIEKWNTSDLMGLSAVVHQGQEVDIFNETIEKNIAFPCTEADRAEVLAAAKLAGIDTDIQNMPKTYETLIGERGHKLSGGQQQRLAIARAALAGKPLLILDEATSSVDPETERKIQEQLKLLLRGKTALIIAHRLSTIRDVDKIIVLHEGKKVEEGSHKELMAKGGRYANLVNLQQLPS